MTGICGWLGGGRPSPEAEHLLQRMTMALPSPTPDGGASYATEIAGLSVRGGAGGFWLHRDDRLWAAIEGLPYWREPALARRAGAHGHAAVLAQVYADAPNACLTQLAGPFSLAILDPTRRRALLAIDRFGVHRLCFAVAADGTLVFGTTTDAVRAHPAAQSEVSLPAVYDYLYTSVCPAPGTIYRGQSKLPAAHRIDFDSGITNVQAYWQMPYDEASAMPRRDLHEVMLSHLRDAVARAAGNVTSARLGAFLSGGLDSSTIVGMMRDQYEGPPNAFTIAFGTEDFDETRYASIAASHFSANHRVHILTPGEVLETIPLVVDSYDEPFGNSSAIPAHHCARMAQGTGIVRMLAGDGGDELFAGNSRYLLFLKLAAWRRLPRVLRRRFLDPLFDRESLRARRSVIGKIARYVALARLDAGDQLPYGRFLSRIDPSEMFEDDALAAIDADAPAQRERAIFSAAPSDEVLTQLMHLDLQVVLADNDLRKVGRMCAIAGVEVTYPFLDESLAEFAARVPARLLADPFRVRRFYKKAMVGFLPSATLRKPKHGFGMPFAEWMKQDVKLRALANDSLADFKRRHYLKPSFIDRVMAEQAGSSASPFDGVAWDVMMLELWLRRREARDADSTHQGPHAMSVGDV